VAHSRFWAVPGAPKNAVEAYIQTEPGLFTDTGEVTDENGAHFLRDYMAEFRELIVRVLTVLPRQA
jgi:chromate reductase